jgi:hypothetical protein
MCWRKLFGGSMEDDSEFLKSTHKALLFGVNNYPGTGNDLNGCLNDIDDFEKKLKALFPQFAVKKFKDSEVTNLKFTTELKKAVESLLPGDDVVVFSDSCFSESNTKNFNVKRFFDTGLRPRKKKIKRQFFRGDEMKWIAFSACQDDQTASDAYFNGKANGAFTYYNLKVMKLGVTYLEHFENIRAWLPSKLFDQVPSLEGPGKLLTKKIFEDPTLIIAYSGHGSYLPDNDGDEIDGVDETLYLYDGHLRDDKIRDILQKIPLLT